MKPGRELDALIAEKIMGFKYEPGGYKRNPHLALAHPERDDPWLESVCEKVYLDSFPHYSTSIEAAWEVVEKLKEDVIDFLYHPDAKAWSVMIGDRNTVAETAPHAICLAALKAVGVEE